jgi:hypothetical protein
MLSDKQQAAIDMIVAGRRYTEVERVVEVSHSQLSQWRKDPEFDARLQDARVSFHEARRDKLWNLADSAMDVLQLALDEKDPKTAMDVLRLVGGGLADVRYAGIDPRGSTPEPPALTEHQGSTEQQGSYRCDSCGKECRSSGGLATHRRTHQP